MGWLLMASYTKAKAAMLKGMKVRRKSWARGKWIAYKRGRMIDESSDVHIDWIGKANETADDWCQFRERAKAG